MQPARSFRSPLVPIFLIVAVDVLGFTIMIPLLPFYAKQFQASDQMVGFIFASYALCQFLFGPILGRWSDKIGRKPVLLVSQIGTFIGFIVLALAGNVWMLFLGRIIDGVTAGNLSIAQAYISDVTKPEERTKAFGYIGIAFGIGFTFGPALSGFLSTFGYAWPAVAAAAMSLTSVICTWFLLPDVRAKHPEEEAQKIGRIRKITQYLERRESRRPLVEFFVFSLSFSVLISGLALFVLHRMHYDAQHTGYLYTFSGVIGAIIQGGLLGMLVKKLGERRLATIGFISMAIGYGLLGFVFGLPFLLVLIVFGGFGSAVVRPSLTTLITKSVGRHEQGAAIGVSQSLQSIGQIVGPLIASTLIEHGMLTAYGATAGGLALIGALFVMSGGHERGGIAEDSKRAIS